MTENYFTPTKILDQQRCFLLIQTYIDCLDLHFSSMQFPHPIIFFVCFPATFLADFQCSCLYFHTQSRNSRSLTPIHISTHCLATFQSSLWVQFGLCIQPKYKVRYIYSCHVNALYSNKRESFSPDGIYNNDGIMQLHKKLKKKKKIIKCQKKTTKKAI